MNCIFTDPAIEWKNVCLILYLDNYSYFALYFKKKQCIYNNVPPPPSGLLSLTHTAECLFTENNALYEQSLRGRRRGGGGLIIINIIFICQDLFRFSYTAVYSHIHY